MNQWEECPKCKGQGVVQQPLSNSTANICPVCMGKMIINSFTGLPPYKIPNNDSFPAGRFIPGTAEVSYDDIP